MLVAVLQEDGAERGGAVEGPGPAGDLVVVHLRQLAGERGELAVLVELSLPPIGHRYREAAAVDDRDRPLQLRRQVRSPLRELPGGVLQVRRRAVDLGAD